MGVIARMKSLAGGPKIPTLASAATLTLPDDTNQVMLTGTTNVTVLRNTANQILPGRRITFIRAAIADKPTFANTPGTTTSGQMDIGANTETTLTLEDVLTFVQLQNGTWRQVDESAN